MIDDASAGRIGDDFDIRAQLDTGAMMVTCTNNLLLHTLHDFRYYYDSKFPCTKRLTGAIY